ncbi:MAG TPA: ATP-binding protein [Gemmatimonadaceae bacterium]
MTSLGSTDKELALRAVQDDVFAGGGEVGALCRAIDWASTPLGSPAGWPQSLRTTVRTMLTSRFAMWMAWGPELTMLYNDAYARMTLGAKHPWALSRPASTVWAEIWKDIGPRIAAVTGTGVATWDEALLLFLERSGYLEETYHTFSYSPLADESGAIAGMLCVVSEDTERVIGERRLKTLRELGAELASATREGDTLRAVATALARNQRDLPFAAVYLFEEDGSARLGCASGTHPGSPVAPRDIPAGDGAWPIADLVQSHRPLVVEELASRFPGVELPQGDWWAPPQRAVLVPIAQRGGERPAGFLVAAVNPFRRFDADYRGFLELVAGQVGASLANARAYEEERRRAEELADLDRAKTQFFSNVSHEFRTPLTLLLGPAEDALGDPETIPANRARMEIIHRNALRLLRLVNTLLDFSRIEAGRVTARYEPTDLAAYTAELASSFRSAMERAGLRLVVESSTAASVWLDREMWEKIVLNLLSNAFKHTFEGEVALHVLEREGCAVLEVRDTGVGIPAEQLPHIFERFHRVPNARSRTHEGTGIGLALVQELVRLHHGTIDVASTPGEGTTFTVAIPLGSSHLKPEQLADAGSDGAMRRLSAASSSAYVEEARRWLPAADDGASSDDDQPIATAAAAPEGAVASPIAGAHVLVADDNADMRDYVTRLLHDRGCVVRTVADGRAALDAALEERPELILSDVMMPGLDGFELISRLRADPRTRGIPVILLSARAGEEARVEGLGAGADDYLVKPFTARELVARVEGRIQIDRGRRESESVRERLLAAVEVERARLQELLRQAPAAIAVLRGPEHRYVSANAEYERLFGAHEYVGRAVREVFPELVEQGAIAMLDTVYSTGIPFVAKAERFVIDTDMDGVPSEGFYTFVFQPITDGNGQVEGIFVHAVDVTDQVRARREAEAAKEAAETANRAKSEFLAAMSHELRTPLNAIGGYAQLLDIGIHGPMSEDQHRALARIQRSQQHLLSLINDVLNFAKLEAGRVEYDIGEVELSRVLATVAPMVEPQLGEKTLAYHVHVPADLRVHADAERVQQIVLNLLSNAIKFTDAGGTIDVDAELLAGTPAMVALRVRDTGIGIPKDKQESIFDPFVQAHRNLTRSTEGTGLGLAISRDLARAMRGELSVSSEVGQGATFTLTLPAG